MGVMKAAWMQEQEEEWERLTNIYDAISDVYIQFNAAFLEDGVFLDMCGGDLDSPIAEQVWERLSLVEQVQVIERLRSEIVQHKEFSAHISRQEGNGDPYTNFGSDFDE
ncbi:hypothetical protein [Leptolyngbya sp. AN10]|uniref:hypothetical protein n=1 Tax=Leptolyngbya sp. AN10 TaxID=3423365 RepID=UPI003D314E91